MGQPHARLQPTGLGAGQQTIVALSLAPLTIVLLCSSPLMPLVYCGLQTVYFISICRSDSVSLTSHVLSHSRCLTFTHLQYHGALSDRNPLLVNEVANLRSQMDAMLAVDCEGKTCTYKQNCAPKHA